MCIFHNALRSGSNAISGTFDCTNGLLGGHRLKQMYNRKGSFLHSSFSISPQKTNITIFKININGRRPEYHLNHISRPRTCSRTLQKLRPLWSVWWYIHTRSPLLELSWSAQGAMSPAAALTGALGECSGSTQGAIGFQFFCSIFLES